MSEENKKNWLTGDIPLSELYLRLGTNAEKIRIKEIQRSIIDKDIAGLITHHEQLMSLLLDEERKLNGQ